MDQWKIAEKDEREDGPYWVTFTDTGLKKRFEWEASVKWDGCIELVRRYNMGDDPEDAGQIHLCDLDQLIAKLQALREAARGVLGNRHGLYENT
jgi:hypothetical protein